VEFPEQSVVSSTVSCVTDEERPAGEKVTGPVASCCHVCDRERSRPEVDVLPWLERLAKTGSNRFFRRRVLPTLRAGVGDADTPGWTWLAAPSLEAGRRPDEDQSAAVAAAQLCPLADWLAVGPIDVPVLVAVRGEPGRRDEPVAGHIECLTCREDQDAPRVPSLFPELILSLGERKSRQAAGPDPDPNPPAARLSRAAVLALSQARRVRGAKIADLLRAALVRILDQLRALTGRRVVARAVTRPHVRPVATTPRIPRGPSRSCSPRLLIG
jgi:hypothetical protein